MQGLPISDSCLYRLLDIPGEYDIERTFYYLGLVIFSGKAGFWRKMFDTP